jgi:hypothetical protein
MSDEKDDQPPKKTGEEGAPTSAAPTSGPTSADPPSDEAVRALVRRAMGGSQPPKASVVGAGEDEPEDQDQDLPPSSEGEPVLDEVDLKDALRGALRPPPGAVAPSLLSGVQKKLRVRSRGKFYGDGWSTAPTPRSTYLVSSVLMLLIIGLVFLALVPWSSTKLP